LSKVYFKFLDAPKTLIKATVKTPHKKMYIYVILTAFVILLALFFPHHLHPITGNLGQIAHFWLSLLTFTIICIAAMHAILLYAQDRLLHRYHHLPNIVKKLPALENMERLLFQMITVGFVLLTLVCVSSAYFFEPIFQPPLLKKTLLAFTIWIIFLILLLGRYLFGWRGRKALGYTLLGFILLILIYFGSEILFA
jgi:ABC-type uncharacterized transport system permease subunit